ncbi:MAG: FAD-binding protein [Planctomycetes bacterium]|nr:FAD-binding protein [Planctomycetota bacterium]
MSSRYNPVTEQVVEELAGIVGAGNVIFGDAERLATFSHDEIPDPSYAHTPEVAVRPAGAEEISRIMKLANRLHIPVTPRGAGSGLSGGAVPIFGGIVLDCSRMNRIIEIDRANMVAVVEPGVITNELANAIRENGLFYAGYPMSLETCQIGGNVAENAGGGKAVKYGVTGRYVLGLEVVTPKGDIVSLGGKLVKDVTGYDLIQLMVGSEGTLGIFTKIILKLLPLPKAAVDLLCLFKTVDQAIGAVPDMIAKTGIIPTSIEFMDAQSVQAACKYLNESLPYQNCGAMLLITVDGADADQVQRDYETIGEACLAAGAFEVYVADNHTTSNRIWRVRQNIPEAFKLVSPQQSGEDIVVPIASIPQIVRGMVELAKKWDVLIPCYGHAGDGNMHTRIVKNPAWTASQWKERLPLILTDLYKITIDLGGTISGEHGIGHKRKPYMTLARSSEYLDICRAIKKALDPNNILNPGKIFDL